RQLSVGPEPLTLALCPEGEEGKEKTGRSGEEIEAAAGRRPALRNGSRGRLPSHARDELFPRVLRFGSLPQQGRGGHHFLREFEDRVKAVSEQGSELFGVRNLRWSRRGGKQIDGLNRFLIHLDQFLLLIVSLPNSLVDHSRDLVQCDWTPRQIVAKNPAQDFFGCLHRKRVRR